MKERVRGETKTTGARIQWKRTTEEWWISEGRIKDGAVWWREVGAGGKEHVSPLIALIWRSWWREDAASALTRTRCPRTQLSDSQLCPQKKKKKKKSGHALATSPGVWMQLSVAFIPAWSLSLLCRADLEWTYFPQTTCSKVMELGLFVPAGGGDGSVIIVNRIAAKYLTSLYFDEAKC